MYKINHSFFEYESSLSLAEVIARHSDDKKVLPKKGFGTYVFLNKRKIDKKDFEDIIINDKDEIVIMPLMGAG